MSKPNPFADETQPEGAVRLQSAADPLDPYTAPVEVAESLTRTDTTAPTEIGMWQHDSILIMHRDAQFPARCVMTNAPIVKLVPRSVPQYDIVWIWKHRLTLRYGLAPQVLIGPLMLRMLAIGSLVCIVIGSVRFAHHLFGTDFVDRSGFFLFLAIPLMSLGILALGLSKLGLARYRPLTLIVSDGDFHWLYGAGPEFLQSLPPWQGKKRPLP